MSSRFQCCGTEQETSAVSPRAILAVLPNSNYGPSVLVARTNLRGCPLSLVLRRRGGLPYPPAFWLSARQTLVVPPLRPQAIQNHGAADGISATQFVSRKAHAVAVATAGFDYAMRDPAAWMS